MTGLLWKINRLRVMGCREVCHRVVREISVHIEMQRTRMGWEPTPSREVKPGVFLFTGNYAIIKFWKSRFHLDTERLEQTLSGRIAFFGHPPMDVGSPVQWHRDPLTGTLSPAAGFGKKMHYRDDSVVGNIKFLWELGRHQHLIPLAVAYVVTGEDAYQKAVMDQISSWIRENPFNRGIHWCSALEAALRLISWAVIHSLFHLAGNARGLFDAVKDLDALGKSIYQHAWFIANHLSRYSSANNHLIGELTGLWTGCVVFDLGREGRKWAARTSNELENEAGKQVFPDGVSREQAIYYHLWVLEYLFFAGLVGSRAGRDFSAGFHAVMDRMAGFLGAITPANGSPPQIGDSDDGMVTRFEPRWPDFPFKEVLSSIELVRKSRLPDSISQKAFWYAMMAQTDLEALQRPSPVPSPGFPVIFQDGGYAVLGDDVIRIVFDAGSLGYPAIAAHGQADALSFCLALNGEWWLVDPGTYAYHSMPEWRNYFRSTSSHNTIEADGKNQSEMGGPFLWTRHASAFLDDWGTDDAGLQWGSGYHTGYRNVIHHRRITYTPTLNEVIISDSMHGRGKHALAIFFHFSPEIEVIYAGPGKWQATRAGCNFIMELRVAAGWRWHLHRGETDPISGWYSPRYGEKEPATTLKGSRSGSLPVALRTVIRWYNGQ